MCPPPRSLALEANGCFMVQVLGGPNRIQGCGAIVSTRLRAPLGSGSQVAAERNFARHLTMAGIPRMGQAGADRAFHINRCSSMARNHTVSIEIYQRHIRLFRFLNDVWIFSQLLRPELKKRGDELLKSTSKAKKRYPVPKRDRSVKSGRRDFDVGQVFKAQYERGLFETNIISIVSRVEAFVQECLVIAINDQPRKLSILDKGGIPLDLFFSHDDREDLLESLVGLKCQELMFAKPAEYLGKVAQVLSIEIPRTCLDSYIELKATRDVLIHNQGRINKIYIEKTASKARGRVGEDLVVDEDYFGEAVMVAKTLSGTIQRETEKKYK